MVVLFRLNKARKASESRVIEVGHVVDAATSIALLAQAREDFHEQTAWETVITFLRRYGPPRQMTFDRDPRWVGGGSGRDFPSPLRRLLLCVGMTPHVCPPHRPAKNPYVERFHRTYGQECLHVHQPSTLQEVREVTEAFLQHDHTERPRKATLLWQCPSSCGVSNLAHLPGPARAG
jgi:transposase InsO family protein